MPYMTTTRTSCTLKSYSDQQYIDSWIVPPQRQGPVVNTLTSYGIQTDTRRSGTNSSSGRFHYVGIGRPVLKNRRVFLGFEEYDVSKLRRYRKDGQLRFRFDHSTRRRKVFGDVPVAEYKSYTLKQKGGYLKPNGLSFWKSSYKIFSPTPIWQAIQIATLGTGVTASSLATGENYGDLVFAFTRNTWNSSPSHYNYSIIAGSGGYFGGTAPSEPSSFSISQEMKDRALIKLYNKIQDDMPNYYSILAESGETIDTLRSIAFRALKLAKDLYRLNVKGIRRQLRDINLKTAADTWLSWVYAISPTVSDLKQSWDVAMREDRVWRSFSAGVDSSFEVTQPAEFVDGAQIHKRLLYCRYGCVLEGVMSLARYLQRAQSWEQTAATVYEVIPFSFMLDWLVDISGYLNAVNVVDGYLVDAWYTEGMIEYKAEVGSPLVQPPSLPIGFYPPTTFTWIKKPEYTLIKESVGCRRVVLSDLPPMPKPIIPTSSQLLDGVSLQRGINALAIAVSKTYGLTDRWSRSVNSDRRKIPLNLIGL
jgi:hypothetical protein